MTYLICVKLKSEPRPWWVQRIGEDGVRETYEAESLMFEGEAQSYREGTTYYIRVFGEVLMTGEVRIDG